ncbi:MAG: LytR C-terminal domain-containing protein [Candidatus Zixiibacteriota bacterium]
MAGAAVVIVLAYIVFFSVRIARGVARTGSDAELLVRLQVLNASGRSGMVSWIADRLNGYSDRELEIKVVDSGNFDLTEVPQSFVISREQDSRSAKALATKLGLDPAAVIIKPLASNHRLVTATLVVGRDYARITLNAQNSKEK